MTSNFEKRTYDIRSYREKMDDQIEVFKSILREGWSLGYAQSKTRLPRRIYSVARLKDPELNDLLDAYEQHRRKRQRIY